jgi:hypothetical protein
VPGKPKPPSSKLKRRWRDYRTAQGHRPVKKFLDGLSDEDAADPRRRQPKGRSPHYQCAFTALRPLASTA